MCGRSHGQPQRRPGLLKGRPGLRVCLCEPSDVQTVLLQTFVLEIVSGVLVAHERWGHPGRPQWNGPGV